MYSLSVFKECIQLTVVTAPRTGQSVTLREGILGFREAQSQATQCDWWENTDYLERLFEWYERK